MGRPRGFDEGRAIQAAAELFAECGYEGTSVDDLVSHLGVHRGSLYKAFGSKRKLYLAALRWHIEHHVTPFVASVGKAAGRPNALDAALSTSAAATATGLLLSAGVEQAAADPEVAELVTAAFEALDRALGGGDEMVTRALGATVLGLHLRVRAGLPLSEAAESATALATQLNR